MEDYDFIIAGAGYSGALLSLCLVKQGFSVGLIEEKSFPRFVIGEGTTPEQNRLHKRLGQELGIPELESISSYTQILSSRLPIAIWPKEAFYFVEDTHNALKSPQELLFQTAPWPDGPDYHVYRPDFDLYLVQLAQRYGCVLHLGISVQTIDQEASEHIQIHCQTAEQSFAFTCRYFIDASGMKSPITKQLTSISDKPKNYPFHSRSTFCHFLNVKTPEQSFASDWEALAIPRSHSTVHYVNETGWAWVIPFNNGISSVGIIENLDRIKLEKENAQEHFYAQLEHRPFLKQALEEATPICSFVKTANMQYCAKKIVGPRWMTLPLASGFLDPLFSTGMALSTQSVWRVIKRSETLKYRHVALDYLYKEEASWFKKEHHMLAKFIAAHYQTMGNLNQFKEVFRLHREAAYMGGIAQDEEMHQKRRDLFGTESSDFCQLIDQIHQHTQSNTDSPNFIETLQSIYKKHDPFEFIGSPLDCPKHPNVYLTRGIPLFLWKLKLIRKQKIQKSSLSVKEFVINFSKRLFHSLFRQPCSVISKQAQKSFIVWRGLTILLGIRK